ncbi:MAG: heme exporter protein CcmD [Stellaceae bacterium]
MAALDRYFAMGGYAVFVWPAYAIALVVIGGVVVLSWRRYRASLRELERVQRDIEASR